jgi:predicted TIM-barrel fold metal-dependent hydrolase
LTQIDLTPIPLVDNHCHGIYNNYKGTDVSAWRQLFTESKDPGLQHAHVATTLFYHRLIRAMAVLFACEPKEEVVLAARQTLDNQSLIQRCLQDARFEALCIDKGYPPQSQVVPDSELSTLAGCRIAPMLRVELVMQDLIAELNTLDEVVEKLKAQLQDVRAQGYVALKSIAAYRTGLAIQTWSDEDVASAFAAARKEVQEQGSVRLGYKPLLDTLLHVVFAEAARQELPIQFHTGYGDADADMLLANPLHLRAVFERKEYRAMPIVLLHESYPYTRQGAYLAAIYGNAYLDLSYGIPFLGYSEMLEFTRAAFDVAPYSKLLYSSDGIGIPEIHWLSAHNGRRIIGQVLWERVSNGELDMADAEQAGSAVLRDNALKLYRL